MYAPPQTKRPSVFKYQVFDKPYQYHTLDRVSLRPTCHPIVPPPAPERIAWSPRWGEEEDEVEGRVEEGGYDDGLGYADGEYGDAGFQGDADGGGGEAMEGGYGEGEVGLEGTNPLGEMGLGV